MTDGLPTDEQLARIERGVRGRIDAHRRAVRSVVGATAGVLLLVGGIAVIRPVGIGASGGGSTAGGSSGDAAASSAQVKIRCLIGDERIVSAPDDPDAIAAACGATAVEFQAGTGRMPSAASAVPEAAAPASPSLPMVVVCRGADGVPEVYPADDRPRTLCERRGALPY